MLVNTVSVNASVDEHPVLHSFHGDATRVWFVAKSDSFILITVAGKTRLMARFKNWRTCTTQRRLEPFLFDCRVCNCICKDLSVHCSLSLLPSGVVLVSVCVRNRFLETKAGIIVIKTLKQYLQHIYKCISGSGLIEHIK